MRWDRCGGLFLMMLATDVVTGLIEGAIVANMNMEGGGEEARASRPPSAAVAEAGFDWQPPPLLKVGAA
jgi:hypothetical protein